MIKKNKVLLISPFFYPEQISTGKWNTHVATSLSNKCDLEVICLHPTYPEWVVTKSQVQLPGIKIHRRGGGVKFPSSAILRRVILESYFAFTCFTFLLKNRKKFDQLLYVFPPSLMGFVCNLIFAQLKVGVIHDLQGVYASKAKGKLSSVIGSAISYVERRAFNRCQRLIFLSKEMMAEAVKSYSLDESKCKLAYPFLTIDNYEDRGSLANIFQKGRLSIVYAGALGEKQNPEMLVKLMGRFSTELEGVICYIFSRGAVFNEAKINYESPQFKFHDLVDESDLPELMLRADVQIIAQAEGTSSGSLPSKLPNILGAYKKMFVVTDENSELSELLSDICGVSVNSMWDIEKLVLSMQKLLAEDDNQDDESRRKVLEIFDIDTVTSLLL